MFFAAFLWWRVSFIRTTPLNHLEPLDPAGDPTSPMLDGNENHDDDTTLLKAAEIHKHVRGWELPSDHCPVAVTLELPR